MSTANAESPVVIAGRIVASVNSKEQPYRRALTRIKGVPITFHTYEMTAPVTEA